MPFRSAIRNTAFRGTLRRLNVGCWPMEPSCLFWSTHVFARPLRCSTLYVHVSKTAHYFPGRLALIIGTMVAFVALIVLCKRFDLLTRGSFLLAVRRCVSRSA